MEKITNLNQIYANKNNHYFHEKNLSQILGGGEMIGKNKEFILVGIRVENIIKISIVL